MIGSTLVMACYLTSGVVGHAPCTRYPISPITIREQATEATFIVVANVELDQAPPKPQPKTEDGEVDLRTAYVVLKIQEVWKGSPQTNEIRQQNRCTECDAMRYRPGTQVIAFLDGPYSDGSFGTRGLEYGYRVIRPVDADVFKVRIQEFQASARIDDKAKKLKMVTESLVECVEDAATRWDGACDLGPGGDFNKQLTRDQVQRLLNVCLEATSYDEGTSLLVEALKAESDPRILAWLVSMLRKSQDSEAAEAWSNAIAWQISKRESRPDVVALAEKAVSSPTAADRRAVVKQILAHY